MVRVNTYSNIDCEIGCKLYTIPVMGSAEDGCRVGLEVVGTSVDGVRVGRGDRTESDIGVPSTRMYLK